MIIGGSRPIFPYPVAALRADADAVGCRILYDGAHILGLWAGGEFQDPLAEGADIVTGSTQKTLPGPLGGLLFCKDRDVLRGIAQTCDDVLGDYGNARVAALAVTLSEMVAFGRDYARAIVANAQALAGALAAAGFALAGADQGFTTSHQVLVYPRGIRVTDIPTAMATARILCSLIPLRASEDTVIGLRLGTSSVTRWGMTPVEMRELARLMTRLLLHAEEPEAIGQEVRKLRASFTTVQYAFPA